MYAVLIEVDVAGVEREAGLQSLRDQIVPSIKQLRGFRQGIWLAGNSDGRGLSLTVWESEEAACDMAERFDPGSSPTAGAAVLRCEIRDVAATA